MIRAFAAVSLALGIGGAPARADDACARRITVTGRAQAAQAPDFATIAIGVEAKAATAAAALDASSTAVAGIAALAGRLGVPPADIGTAAVVLEAAYRTVSRPNGASQEPDGYRASNRVSLRLADMGRLGDLLRQALDAGANRIDSVGFGLKDPDAVAATLRLEAARNARAQAEALAGAVGAKIGALCDLTAGQSQPPGPMPAFRTATAISAKRVPIEAGTIESAAEVTAAFAVLP